MVPVSVVVLSVKLYPSEILKKYISNILNNMVMEITVLTNETPSSAAWQTIFFGHYLINRQIGVFLAQSLFSYVQNKTPTFVTCFKYSSQFIKFILSYSQTFVQKQFCSRVTNRQMFACMRIIQIKALIPTWTNVNVVRDARKPQWSL